MIQKTEDRRQKTEFCRAVGVVPYHPARSADNHLSSDRTTGHSTDKTTSHSTRLSKDDNQVAGYRRANNARLVAGHVFCPLSSERGFTMVEMITVIVILGILAAVAAPRFFDRNVFDSRGFYDQVSATLRYAQKAAIAQRRFVCVAFGANSVTLTQGTTNACGGSLVSPTGQTPYTVTAPSGVVFGTTPAPVDFNFSALGRPNVGQPSISVNGYATAIAVEAETGYVH